MGSILKALEKPEKYMNRQKLLNNFVERCDGKGRCFDNKACQYFHPEHPGCAFGCQPGFKEAFQKYADSMENRTMVSLVGGIVVNQQDTPSLYARLREFFELGPQVRSSDLVFISHLQELHDNPEHWTPDGYLEPEVVRTFCFREDLSVPELGKADTVPPAYKRKRERLQVPERLRNGHSGAGKGLPGAVQGGS